MSRFYLPSDQWQGNCWEVRGSEAHHALKVMRLRTGDTCTLFDGKGRAAEVRIVSSEGSACFHAEPVSFLSPALPQAEITLCQSVPKGGNMDLIIQKAVELGVGRIIPVITERTVVRLSPSDAEAKAEKWRRTVLEACKQCGQNTLPVLETPCSFTDLIRKTDLPEYKILAALLPEANPMRGVLEAARVAGVRSAALLVGPEGDFSPSEYEIALARGFLPISLGSIILRVETATFLAVSALRYALDPE